MSLDEWRTQIDDLDRRLLRLLGQRAELSVAIGRAKREAGQPVFVPERERVLVDDLVRLTPSPLQTDAVRAIWGEILSSSRGLQQSFHVAHFGPTATFTHQAAAGYEPSTFRKRQRSRTAARTPRVTGSVW